MRQGKLIQPHSVHIWVKENNNRDGLEELQCQSLFFETNKNKRNFTLPEKFEKFVI